jgi:hypothetical protein
MLASLFSLGGCDMADMILWPLNIYDYIRAGCWFGEDSP